MRLHSPFTGSRLNRRTIAAVAAIALVSAPLVGQIPHASAFESWCWDDPIVYINGVQQSITVGMRQSDLSHLKKTGAPVTVTLHAPKNASIYVPPANQQPQGAFPVQTVVLYDKAPQYPVNVVQTVTTVQADTVVTFEVDLVNGNGVHTTKTQTTPYTLTANFNPKTSTASPGSDD